MALQRVAITVKCGKSEIEYQCLIQDYDTLKTANEIVKACGNAEVKRIKAEESD